MGLVPPPVSKTKTCLIGKKSVEIHLFDVLSEGHACGSPMFQTLLPKNDHLKTPGVCRVVSFLIGDLGTWMDAPSGWTRESGLGRAPRVAAVGRPREEGAGGGGRRGRRVVSWEESDFG